MVKKKKLASLLLAATLSLFVVDFSRAGTVPIPPGEKAAKGSLDTSVRHHEWVKIAIPGTEAQVNTFVAYPERKDKAPVVVVIHEVYGLTDWIRAVADQLAGDGFIAIAPDLLSGKGPGGGGTDAFASRDDVVKAVRDLSPPDVVNILNAVGRYGTTLPAATSRFAAVGFCWGGAQSFFYATAQPNLNAAVVYYGTSPAQEALTTIRPPVLGLYGEDDARVTSTIEPAALKIRELGKTYITHIYKGAGHGFLRAQDERGGANLEASRQAWPATIEFLKKNLQ
jgi:carboxymethylenebutenolidase